jgi:hypothetical protein
MNASTEQLPEAVRWLLADRADQTATCGCSGQCGHHPGSRCPCDGPDGLTVAPADLTIPIEQAATLPADQLIVWCHHCRGLAEAASHRLRREQIERQLEQAQLGLWVVA